MAVTDERSSKHNLPIPVSSNRLKDDVVRLRDALTSIDNGLLFQAESFDVLRARKPDFVGERVYLQSYNAGWAAVAAQPTGGGLFVGYLSAQADDGGFVAGDGATYHWRRDKALEDLTVLDFGARGDGVTDDAPAVQRMYAFIWSDLAALMTGGKKSGSTITGGRSTLLPIRFGPGTYFVSPLEFLTSGKAVPAGAADAAQNPSGFYAAGDFRMEGVSTGSGRQILTRIISDKSLKPVFNINHRRMTVHGITWDGQQTVAQDMTTKLLTGATIGIFNDTASNKQPFLKNQCPGGLFLTLTSFNASNTGGATFDILDTLDTTIKQCFSSKTAAPVFQVGWSNQASGTWDHSTAMRVEDCNFQNFMAPVFWAPRSTNGIMINTWFEHGFLPFDFNNGQWDMYLVNVEDCARNPLLWNGKFKLMTGSVPTGNNFDRDTTPNGGNWPSYPNNPDGSAITSWFSGYENGFVRIENHTANFDNAIRWRWQSGVLRTTNNQNANVWMNIGSFETQNTGGIWEIEVIASNYNSVASSPLPAINDRSPGKTIIQVQRGAGSTPKVTFYHIGEPAVRAVQYQNQQFNTIIPALWIQIATYTGEVMVNVKGTGPARLDQGQCNMFTPSGVVQAASPNLTAATPRVSLHNGLAGVGAQGDVVAIQTRSQASGTIPVDQSKPRQWMRQNINGIEYAVPYYAYTPQISSSPPANYPIAAGQTISLTALAADAATYQWQKSTDGGTNWANISGATAFTYTKTGAATADNGQYRCLIKGQLGAADSSVTTNQVTTTPTTVTVS